MQLLFNKVDFGASDFEAAVGLQVEAAGKMKVAAGVLDHRTIQNCFAWKNFFELTTPNAHPLTIDFSILMVNASH